MVHSRSRLLELIVRGLDRLSYSKDDHELYTQALFICDSGGRNESPIAMLGLCCSIGQLMSCVSSSSQRASALD